MITRFQFESVEKLIDSGVYNYVQIRQQLGLTSAQLDEILNNMDFYKQKFAEEDRIAHLKEQQIKKPWWKRK